jgi:hypothetical protein
MAPKLGSVLGSSRKNKNAFWIELDTPKDRANFKTVTEWSERSKAVQRMVPYLAATEAFTVLMSKVPKDLMWRYYVNSLKLVRVGPRTWSAGVHAIYGRPSRRDNPTIDTDTNVLYVRPKKNRTAKVPESVRVLAKYGPWTVDTLPFTPKSTEALVVSRRVSKREVEEITKARKQDAVQWKHALAETGVKLETDAVKKPKFSGKVRRDIAFDALRLEFGHGSNRSVPHWRPAVRSAVRLIKQLMTRRSFLTTAMLKSGSKTWKKWPPNVASSIRIADLNKLKWFQSKLKVRS